MAVDTVADFASMLAQGRLLGPAQLEEISIHLQSQFPQPRALAAELLRRDWLTPFQVNQIFKGCSEELLLGSYVLLERLGSGGMGEVYKARNWKLDKIVAIKLIRPQRLRDSDTLRRFQREIRAAAQLNHPNVVHAYDCDEANGKHFLVLEYAEGIDLARFVKKHGPLPIAQTCDYIRQAALGLQHAFERGLVHRDIKPHNLLLTQMGGEETSAGGIIKILDMGLARWDQPAGDSDTPSSMTEEGTVMGTVDYMAPEQALDAHAADIRADLYSLGCTFYFLLTGQVPFPGGSATEKLLKHQTLQPEPVEQLRPSTPPTVAAILNKMTVKRPEGRYQTPAEVAEALSQIDNLAETVVYQAPAPQMGDTKRGQSAEAMADTSPSWSSLATPADPAEIVSRSDERRAAASQRKRWLFITCGASLLVLSASLPSLLHREGPPTQQARPAAEQSPPKEKTLPTFDEWVQQTAKMPAERQVKEVAVMLKKRNPGFDGTVTPTIKGDVIIGLEFHSENIIDLRPLRALQRLQTLICSGTREIPGKLSNLSPLKDMKLTIFNCSFTRVADLSPLHGIPLRGLYCASTNISDLTPLQGMPLTFLNINGNVQIKDLSPLRGMRLTTLFCQGTKVTDLSPLRDMPLTTLTCPLPVLKDQETLRTLKDLKFLNRKPSAEFWKQGGKTPSFPKELK